MIYSLQLLSLNLRSPASVPWVAYITYCFPKIPLFFKRPLKKLCMLTIVRKNSIWQQSFCCPYFQSSFNDNDNQICLWLLGWSHWPEYISGICIIQLYKIAMEELYVCKETFPRKTQDNSVSFTPENNKRQWRKRRGRGRNYPYKRYKATSMPSDLDLV